MLFAIGTRVRFRYTGETGLISALLDDNMLSVRLDSDPDFEIPAFEEDLVRDEGAARTVPGAKFVQTGKTEAAKPAPPPRRVVQSQYVILKSRGIQLGFEPMPGREGSVTRFKAWLINDTKFDVWAEFSLYVLDELVLKLEDKLPAISAIDAGDILFDDLNDAPEVEFNCRRFTTAGMDEPIYKELKIKPKQFFNKLLTAPVLNVLVHHYPLIESFEAPKNESSTEDLKAYTEQKVRDQKNERRRQDPIYVSYDVHNPEEYASFVPEIDLHIENLVNGRARIDPGMMLRIQMGHFERFMEKAIRLGVPSVFLIHGVGEGKLREAIARRLKEMPEVRKFKNEFHSKYGYGATEVLFR